MSEDQFNEKRITLIVVGVLVLVSCLALASFAMRKQESTERQTKEAAEKQKEEGEFKNWTIDREAQEIKEALEKETDPNVRAKLEARLRERKLGYAYAIGEAGPMKDSLGGGLDAAK